MLKNVYIKIKQNPFESVFNNDDATTIYIYLVTVTINLLSEKISDELQ